MHTMTSTACAVVVCKGYEKNIIFYLNASSQVNRNICRFRK